MVRPTVPYRVTYRFLHHPEKLRFVSPRERRPLELPDLDMAARTASRPTSLELPEAGSKSACRRRDPAEDVDESPYLLHPCTGLVECGDELRDVRLRPAPSLEVQACGLELQHDDGERLSEAIVELTG
ncbi:MAG: hypothetical protein AAFU79_02985 [Myxococcota bacterium]